MKKKWLFFLPLTMLATELMGEIRSDVEQCVAVEDSTGRLICFDKFANQYLSKPALTSQTKGAEAETAAVNSPELPERSASRSGAVSLSNPAGSGADNKTSKASWGLFKKKSHKDDELLAVIASVRQLQTGHYLLTLENGQIWRETDLKRRSRYRVGDEVVIQRRTLGSFVLKSNRTGFRNTVKRVE